MIVESYEDVIVLSGALRSNHWETIHTALALVLKRHPTGVIIDCSNLTEMTPAGGETFHDAMDFIKNHDARIFVAGVPANVMEVLKQVPEVKSQLPIAPSVESARKSLDLLWEDPDAVHGKKKKKIAVPGNARKIIVGLYIGTSISEDDAAMKVASQLADSEPSAIYLVCALIVSRDQPLQAALPDAEASAAAAIERAKNYFDKKGIAHLDQIERGRDLASALSAANEEINADMFVIPMIQDPVKIEQHSKAIGNLILKLKGDILFVGRGMGS